MQTLKNMKTIAKIELELAENGKTTIDDDGNADGISYYLRAHNGRRDLGEVVRANSQSTQFLSQLENIRTFFKRFEYQQAKNIIDQCQPTSVVEQNELNLENARYYYFVHEYQTAFEILQKLIDSSDVLLTSRITANEIAGQCLYHLHKKETAISYFKKSMQYLETLPFTFSAFVAGAHLVKTYSELKDFKKASSALSFLKKCLGKVKQEEAWASRQLLLIRARCHFFKNSDDRSMYESHLLEALHLADWLGDKHTKNLCEKELGAVAPSTNNMVLLPHSSVLLFRNPKKVSRLEGAEMLAKILMLLQVRPYTEEELFAAVWNLEYHKERHSAHLRATLSKLRRKLPDNSLLLSQGVIALKV